MADGSEQASSAQRPPPPAYSPPDSATWQGDGSTLSIDARTVVQGDRNKLSAPLPDPARVAMAVLASMARSPVMAHCLRRGRVEVRCGLHVVGDDNLVAAECGPAGGGAGSVALAVNLPLATGPKQLHQSPLPPPYQLHQHRPDAQPQGQVHGQPSPHQRQSPPFWQDPELQEKFSQRSIVQQFQQHLRQDKKYQQELRHRFQHFYRSQIQPQIRMAVIKHHVRQSSEAAAAAAAAAAATITTPSARRLAAQEVSGPAIRSSVKSRVTTPSHAGRVRKPAGPTSRRQPRRSSRHGT